MCAFQAAQVILSSLAAMPAYWMCAVERDFASQSFLHSFSILWIFLLQEIVSICILLDGFLYKCNAATAVCPTVFLFAGRCMQGTCTYIQLMALSVAACLSKSLLSYPTAEKAFKDSHHHGKSAILLASMFILYQ